MVMRNIFLIIRPDTLKSDGTYYLRLHRDNTRLPEYYPVVFVDYDPCPAMILVKDFKGKIWRIPREDVFSTEVSVHDI